MRQLTFVLETKEESVLQEDDDLDIPLAHPHLLPEHDELDSLHSFISRTIDPFVQKLNLTIDRSHDMLPQAIRKYKHRRFDVSKVLIVSFKMNLV